MTAILFTSRVKVESFLRKAKKSHLVHHWKMLHKQLGHTSSITLQRWLQQILWVWCPVDLQTLAGTLLMTETELRATQICPGHTEQTSLDFIACSVTIHRWHLSFTVQDCRAHSSTQECSYSSCSNTVTLCNAHFSKVKFIF